MLDGDWWCDMVYVLSFHSLTSASSIGNNTYLFGFSLSSGSSNDWPPTRTTSASILIGGDPDLIFHKHLFTKTVAPLLWPKFDTPPRLPSWCQGLSPLPWHLPDLSLTYTQTQTHTYSVPLVYTGYPIPQTGQYDVQVAGCRGNDIQHFVRGVRWLCIGVSPILVGAIGDSIHFKVGGRAKGVNWRV